MITSQLTARVTALWPDRRGAMAIETAFILPILIVMSLGGFETSRIISRQFELQSVAGEAEIIAMAAAAGAETSADKVKKILMASADVSEGQIKVSRFYRCDASETTVSSSESCEEDAVVTSYISIAITDSYDPIWTDFGVGEKVDMQVERTVVLP